jgi:hypothetical protein
VEEFTEAIESSERALRKTYADRGVELDENGNVSDANYTGREFRSDAVKDLQKQARDSDEEAEILNDIWSSFDTGVSKRETRA